MRDRVLQGMRHEVQRRGPVRGRRRRSDATHLAKESAVLAAMLNRLGRRIGRGNPWTEARVRSHRNSQGVAVHRPGEVAERGELTITEAAERVGASTMTVLRLIADGTMRTPRSAR